MGNLLQLQSGTKSIGARKLFNEASFAVNEGEHVGVIGPNGAGKTTLFRILTDEESLDSGEIIKARGLRLGYLAQHDHFADDLTVETFLSTDTLKPIWELKTLGLGLGLDNDMYARTLKSLSGGYRMRCKLLKLLGQEPDLMLLDEPTNYLDLDSILVLENFLQDFNGAFLLISHDREFLRRTTDHILEIESGDMTKFNGHIDDYFEQKTMLREQLESRAMSLAQKRQEVLDFVNRFGAKASKARQAQSRLKSLDRMEHIEVKALPVTASIRIPEPVRTGKNILQVQNVDLGYGPKVVLQQLNFEIQSGDHVAVVGVNGAGKSTFLKSLAQDLSPLKGEIKLGYQVTLGYYAQHVAEALHPRSTVIEAMAERVHPDVSRQEVLNMAGSLLFSGDDMHKVVSVLSGGEKSRVALGRILLQRAPCLILDEPTNHLDFQTVEALTLALAKYPGSVIVVSHDRSFIRRVGTKILEIRDGSAHLYPGTYEDYIWSLQRGALRDRKKSEVSATSVSRPAPSVVRSVPRPVLDRKVLQQELNTLQKSLATAEKRIASTEAKLQDLNDKISSGAGSPELKQWISDLEKFQKELSDFEQQWMESGERIEELKSALGMSKG